MKQKIQNEWFDVLNGVSFECGLALYWQRRFDYYIGIEDFFTADIILRRVKQIVAKW